MLKKPLRILYMEDEVDAAQLARSRLQKLGYHVDLAANGEEGLALYRQGYYDLIAVDQHMPSVDGLTVLRRLAVIGNLPPTIMVTGTGSEAVAVEALKLGASDYIVKDVNGNYLDLLPTVIEQVLSQRQLLDERRDAVAALERRNQDLVLLNQAGQTFTATLDLTQLTRLLLKMAIQLIRAEGSSIWLWDPARPGWLVCQIVHNNGEQYSPLNLRLKPGEGVAGWVALYGQSVIVTDAENDDRFSSNIDEQTGFETRSLVAVPLTGRDGNLGVLEVVNKREGHFDDEDLTLIEALATPAAIAIDNARMVEALRRRAAELQERNEELDAFAHTVAHDLKSPLVALVGHADVLTNFYASLSAEERQESTEAILRAGQKMSNIIEELLLLAGVRQMDIEPEVVDMAAIFEEAESRVSGLVLQYNARITAPKIWPPAWGYGPWLEEVWVNYLSNAIKYGGRPPEIRVGATPEEDGSVTFWIKDNGNGISDEDHSRLFVPFSRLTELRVEGYGLGLSIVRRIVEKLGGTVGLESTVGKGSTFYFTLPQVG